MLTQTQTETEPAYDGSPLLSWRRLEDLLEVGRETIQAVAQQAGRYYQPFDRRKIRGTGKWRHIDNPQSELKALQRKIQRQLLAHFPFPESIVGGVRERSVLDHAKKHIQKLWVVTLDIKECFPSISNGDIFSVLRNYLGASTELANVLTRLTTFQHRLPQGAPTSPALANLALLPLCKKLFELAQRLELDFTMYVDDIAFSGDNAVFAIEPACRIIKEYGFRVSWQKTRVLSNEKPQEVGGLLVNNRINTLRQSRRQIRKDIMSLAEIGAISERDLHSIWGRIRYVKYIRPAAGAVLEEFARRHLPEMIERGGMPRHETRECRRFERDHSG